MIVEYLRPESLDKAIQLIQRKEPRTLPLGGGSVLSHDHGTPIAVVDLQKLGLGYVKKVKEDYFIGATATLTQIEESIANPILKSVIRLQAGKNKRNTGTLAGLINAADGRSPLLALLLAMDMQTVWQPGNISISLKEWLAQRDEWEQAELITEMVLPDVEIAFDYVARSPKDLPIISVAAAMLPSGKMNVVVGGFGSEPIVVSSNGKVDDIERSVDLALIASGDQWASAEYRREAGKKIAVRLINELNEKRAR